MIRWKITGIIATIVILFCPALYLLKGGTAISEGDSADSALSVVFVGSVKCKDCHKHEYEKWVGSHHDHAMHVANDETVLGNFNDKEFDGNGILSRFYRKDGHPSYTGLHFWHIPDLNHSLVCFPSARCQVSEMKANGCCGIYLSRRWLHPIIR